jgi:hypothetical protein
VRSDDQIYKMATILAGRYLFNRPKHWRAYSLAEQLRFVALAYSPTHDAGLTWFECYGLCALANWADHVAAE